MGLAATLWCNGPVLAPLERESLVCAVIRLELLRFEEFDVNAATQLGADPVVDVCIATFRRASLADTLDSLSGLVGAPPFRVIVADNDETPSARGIVNAVLTNRSLDILYVHAPARNISIARNACLDAARGEFVAFLDDDETAPSTWLAEMLRHLQAHQLDVVFGPVKAEYAADAPGWAVRGDFHSFGPAIRANGEIDTGYSSNVLFRRATIGALRFDPGLGRTGGEDTHFFATLHARGAKLGFCETAAVYEPTAPSRISMQWLTRRSFRSGQTHARVLRERGQGVLQIAVPAAAKAVFCAGVAVLTVWSPVRVRANIIRGALHVGVIAKALGVSEPVLYGAPETAAS